jgi:TolA-binding protein
MGSGDFPGSTPDSPSKGKALINELAKAAELAAGRLGAMSDVQDARGLTAVLSNFGELPRARHGRQHSRLTLAVGVAVMAALVLGGATFGRKLLRKQPLSFVMNGGEVQAGGYFRIGDHARPSIQFSDGSKLSLVGGARGRVASVDEHGARVMLDDGEAHVEVVPRAGARWMFDAGPFLVNVHGTAFDLGWNADEGQLDVRLQRGAVSVEGPVSAQAISLHGGQWLTVRLATHEVFVRNLEQAATAAVPAAEPAPASSPAVAPPAAASSEPDLESAVASPRNRHGSHHRARSAISPAHQLDWSSARAAGEWGRIVDGATRRGIDRTLAERGSDDLALLADAAHYLHRDDIAERALLTQRKRFAGSTRAKDAAFLLGRIVESRPGGASEALSWYDCHLEEAPTGVYASEALGRKMTVLGRLRGEEAARPIAEEYLRRYPAGTYARAARAYAQKP